MASRGDKAIMAYFGIALNLIGLALQLNPYYQNAWLSLLCVFFGGGFFFLGAFGSRLFGSHNTRDAASSPSMLDRIQAAGMFSIVVTWAVFFGFLLLMAVGRSVYAIINRELDIQAARTGLSTPSIMATPTSEQSR
jgi:hypothetical protein